MSSPIMAITTNSSTSVMPRRDVFMIGPSMNPRHNETTTTNLERPAARSRQTTRVFIDSFRLNLTD